MDGLAKEERMGKLLFGVGIIGMILCILLLILLPGIFEKQKKNMIKKINEDEM